MVITKQLKKGMEAKLLGLFYRDYIDKFGRGVRNLDEFPILITAAEIYLARMPELQERTGNLVRYRFVDITEELKAKGLLRFDSRTSYYLTEEGYRQGGMTRWDKCLDFCNRNAGMAVVVAVVSALISIASLVVAIVALSITPAAPAPTPSSCVVPPESPSSPGARSDFPASLNASARRS